MNDGFRLPPAMVAILGEEQTAALVLSAAQLSLVVNARGIKYFTFARPYADEKFTTILFSVIPMGLS